MNKPSSEKPVYVKPAIKKRDNIKRIAEGGAVIVPTTGTAPV